MNIIYDIEVYPNFFHLSLKKGDKYYHVGLKELKLLPFNDKNVFWIGFNNRRYDHPIIEKALKGATEHELYLMSKGIVSNEVDAISWNENIIDLYEICPKMSKCSLKEMGHRMQYPHLENLPYSFDKHLSEAGVGIQAILAEGKRAQTSINDELAQLREFEAELQEALGQFQTEVAARNSEVTEKVAGVNAGVAAYSAEEKDHLNSFNALAGQYQGDLQRYAGEVTAKVQEFQGKIQLATSYLAEAQTRVGAASSYDGKAALAWQTGNGYIKHFRDEMELYRKGTLNVGQS